MSSSGVRDVVEADAVPSVVGGEHADGVLTKGTDEMLRHYRLDVNIKRVVRHWGLLSTRGETAAAGGPGSGWFSSLMIRVGGSELADQLKTYKGGEAPGAGVQATTRLTCWNLVTQPTIRMTLRAAAGRRHQRWSSIAAENIMEVTWTSTTDSRQPMSDCPCWSLTRTIHRFGVGVVTHHRFRTVFLAEGLASSAGGREAVLEFLDRSGAEETVSWS